MARAVIERPGIRSVGSGLYFLSDLWHRGKCCWSCYPCSFCWAFSLVLPITGVVLGILVLLTLSYREVVQVYTKAGGSYVVARDNFGPRVAQIAAVALLIDYVVTVAVQTAAGTVAVVSAIRS